MNINRGSAISKIIGLNVQEKKDIYETEVSHYIIAMDCMKNVAKQYGGCSARVSLIIARDLVFPDVHNHTCKN